MPPKKVEKKAPAKVDESGISKNDVTFSFRFEIKHQNIADIMLMVEWINPVDTTTTARFDTDLVEVWSPVAADAPDVVSFTKSFEEMRVDDDFVKLLTRAQKFYVYFVSSDDQKVKHEIRLNYSPLLMDKENVKFEFFSDKVGLPEIEYFKLILTANKELLTPEYKNFLNPLQFSIIGAKELPDSSATSHNYLPVYARAKFFDGTEIKTHELPHGGMCKWYYKQVVLAGLMDPAKLKEALASTPIQLELHDQDEIAKNTVQETRKLIEIKEEEEEKPPEDPKQKGKKDTKGKPAPKEGEKEKEKEKDKGKKDAKKKKDVKAFEPIVQVNTKEVISSNYGLANFMLTDLLKPSVRTVKLRSFLVPIQKYVNNDFQNLDLNTTARKESKSAHISTSYLEHGSYLVIAIDIANEVGSYKKPGPLVEQEPEVKKVDPKKKPAPLDDKKSPVSAKKPVVAAAKPDTKGAKAGQAQTLPTEPEVVEIDPKAIYERAVYVFPYKSYEMVQKLQQAVAKINLEGLGSKEGNVLLLTTKSLSPEEKNNQNLDIITGFEFMDSEYRTFMLEGLGDRGMKKLQELFPREEPNSETTKILKNPDVLFKNRLYVDYNCDIKKIKLRENLTKLLINPDIYLRSKVPEHIYDTLVILNELRRCWNIKEVVNSNLFPDKTHLISLERKYGDALTDEDITGIKAPPKKSRKRGFRRIKEAATDNSLISKEASMSQGRQTFTQTASQTGTTFSLNRAPSQHSLDNHIYETNVTKDNTKSEIHIQIGSSSAERGLKSTDLRQLRSSLPPPRKPEDAYNFHMKQLYPIEEGQVVYNSANQKQNIYERQKEELREIVRNDPNHFYTYSLDYMSQSIDPYTAEEARRNEEQWRKSKFRTPNGFQTIARKSEKIVSEHSKKRQEKMPEIKSEPYHEYKARIDAAARKPRGHPLPDINKDFNNRVKNIPIFSSPKIHEEEKITAVEKERRDKEAKDKELEGWKSKLIVDNPHMAVSTASRFTQLDKYRGLREGPANKIGILMKNSRMKESTLDLTRKLEDPPISIYLEEPFAQTSDEKLFERKYMPEKSVGPNDFVNNTKVEVRSSMVYKPTKNVF